MSIYEKYVFFQGAMFSFFAGRIEEIKGNLNEVFSSCFEVHTLFNFLL